MTYAPPVLAQGLSGAGVSGTLFGPAVEVRKLPVGVTLWRSCREHRARAYVQDRAPRRTSFTLIVKLRRGTVLDTYGTRRREADMRGVSAYCSGVPLRSAPVAPGVDKVAFLAKTRGPDAASPNLRRLPLLR